MSRTLDPPKFLAPQKKSNGFAFKDGQKVPTGKDAVPSYGAMAMFNSDSEACNKSRQPKQKRGRRSGANAGAPHTAAPRGNTPQRDTDPPNPAMSSAPRVPFVSRESAAAWDIYDERGMELPLTVTFSGSMSDFASKKVPVSGTDAGAGEVVKFDCTEHSFHSGDIADIAHSDKRRDVLESDMAHQASLIAKDNNAILPLSLHVGASSNPLSFPVGVISSHAAFNTVLCPLQSGARSGAAETRFAAILQPGTCNNGNKIDVRHEVDRDAIAKSTKYVGADPNMDIHKRAGCSVVQVTHGSHTHETLKTLVAGGKIPQIDFDNTTRLETETVIQNVPKSSAMKAVRTIENTQKLPVGQMSIKNVKFSLVPLNASRSWTDHHLSGAGYDMKNNKTMYKDTVERPVTISCNFVVEHL